MLTRWTWQIVWSGPDWVYWLGVRTPQKTGIKCSSTCPTQMEMQLSERLTGFFFNISKNKSIASALFFKSIHNNAIYFERSPTGHLTDLELQNPSYEVSELHGIGRSHDLQALKLWTGWSGRKLKILLGWFSRPSIFLQSKIPNLNVTIFSIPSIQKWGPLRCVLRPPRPRVQWWSLPHRHEVLHQWTRPELQPPGKPSVKVFLGGTKMSVSYKK